MEQLDVRILDRDYRLSVSEDDKPRLLQAVEMVDAKMRTIRDKGRISGIDRVAVMAALQLAHELLGAGEASGAAREATGAAATEETVKRIRKINESLALEIKRQDDLF